MARAALVDDDKVEEPVDSLEAMDDTDNVEQVEAYEAPAPVEQPQDDLPDKYRNKSVKELAAMHQELERLLGRQAEEVRTVRELADSLIKAKATTPPQQSEEPDELDFFENPDKAISKAIEKHPVVQDAKKYSEAYRRNAAQAQLVSAHPDMSEILKDPAFGQWVQSSRIRVQLFQRADQDYDTEAAHELFTNWKERKGLAQQTVEADRKVQRAEVKRAATGSGRGSAEGAGKKIYRRSDLMDLMIKNPERYEALQPEIMRAYAEKRVR